VMAIVGVLIGVGGLALNFGNWISERPDLSIKIESVTLQGEVNIANLPEQLAGIEEKHGHVTGNSINTLRTLASTIDPETKAGLDEFASKLQDAVALFVRQSSTDSGSISATDITLAGGIVNWPDGTQVDLRSPEGALVFPVDLVREVRRDPDHISGSTVASLRERAVALYGAHKSPGECRAVAEDLRRIRTSVRDALEGLDKKVTVKITMENHSKLPTFVQGVAMLRVFPDNKSNIADIAMLMDSPGFLEGYSIKTFQLFSRRAASLKEEDRKYLEQAMAHQDNCILALQDLHGKLWCGTGRVSDSNRTDAKIFIDALDSALKKWTA
jgi:hypothetical protein